MNILDTQEAYSDFTGNYELSKYNTRLCKIIATNDPIIKFAVRKFPAYDSFAFKIWVLHDDLPVGTFGFCRQWSTLLSPSCYLREEFRGRGYAKAVYSWLLNSGFTLINTEGQSEFSHRLWLSLSKTFIFLLVDQEKEKVLFTNEKAVQNSKISIDGSVLLAKGMTIKSFKKEYALN